MTDIDPVEVTVHVPAAPADVFPYFTDPARYVQWMGSEARLEPVPGGVYRVVMPDGFAAAGVFRRVERPRLVVFTWGFADDEAASRTKGGEAASVGAMPAGSTRVTVTLEDADGGTRVTLRHENLPSAELRAGHEVAWDTYLPRLAVVAAGGDPGADPHA
ncbi:MAG TPA: SRPBCC domain-containing protein [Actinomycetota bacterium]|nr:SRPBCC domain-containing protein [Actinomycetota bacterium]